MLSAHRYKTEGSPKYSAIYELERPDVPESEAWNKAVERTSMKRGGSYLEELYTYHLQRIYSKD